MSSPAAEPSCSVAAARIQRAVTIPAHVASPRVDKLISDSASTYIAAECRGSPTIPPYYILYTPYYTARVVTRLTIIRVIDSAGNLAGKTDSILDSGHLRTQRHNTTRRGPATLSSAAPLCHLLVVVPWRSLRHPSHLPIPTVSFTRRQANRQTDGEMDPNSAPCGALLDHLADNRRLLEPRWTHTQPPNCPWGSAAVCGHSVPHRGGRTARTAWDRPGHEQPHHRGPAEVA